MTDAKCWVCGGRHTYFSCYLVPRQYRLSPDEVEALRRAQAYTAKRQSKEARK